MFALFYTSSFILHACREMGDEFRAWYGQLSHLRSLLLTGTPVLALTATATQRVRDSINWYLPTLLSCQQTVPMFDTPCRR